MERDPLQYWYISVPNGRDQKGSLKELHDSVRSRSGDHWHLSRIPLRTLRVGTIDNLITLSDNLGRIDAFGKSLVQKLHRTYQELEEESSSSASAAAAASSSGGSSLKGGAGIQLDVHKMSVHGYITEFEWDSGHLNPRLKLQVLVQNIHETLQKTAEKLRAMSSRLSEVNSRLSVIERKKTASLMTKSLKEYVDSRDWKDGEFIRSCLVVVPLNKQQEFLETYQFLEDSEGNARLEERLRARHEQALKNARELEAAQRAAQEIAEAEGGDDAAAMRGDTAVKSSVALDGLKEDGGDGERKMDDRKRDGDDGDAGDADGGKEKPFFINMMQSHNVRTVVPNSARELTQDGEGILYMVYLLRKGYDWFKLVSREQGFIARDFSFDEDKDRDEEKTMAELKRQSIDQTKKLKIFCRSTFADTFVRVIHLKVIRVFVESVLRFGLPVDFSVSVVKPPKGNEKRLLKGLEHKYAHLLDKSMRGGPQENEVDFSGVGSDFYPFVLRPCNLICNYMLSNKVLFSQIRSF